MGFYKYLSSEWKKPSEELKLIWRERLLNLRREPVTLRIDRPTKLHRARALGYKPKQGIFMVRQMVSRGPHRKTWSGGKKSSKMSTYKILRKNYQMIAEERANKKYPNCEVLNSYFLAKDARNYWYEIIFVDRSHPAITSDDKLKWIASDKGRTFRGITSAGRKIRGLHYKGKGVEKARPSRRANKRLQ